MFPDNFWLFDPSLQVPSQSLLRNIFLKGHWRKDAVYQTVMGTGNLLSRLAALVKLHRNLLERSGHVKRCLQDLLAFCPMLPGPVLDSPSRHLRFKGLFSLQSEGEQSKLHFLTDQVVTILSFFMTLWFFKFTSECCTQPTKVPSLTTADPSV